MVAFAKSEQQLQVVDLRHAFQESDLPFRVDLFVWNEISERFRSQIEQKHVVLKNDAAISAIGMARSRFQLWRISA